MSKKSRRLRQIGLLELFKQVGDFYEEKEVDGVWYVKHYNRVNDTWQVMKFKSQETFKRYKFK